MTGRRRGQHRSRGFRGVLATFSAVCAFFALAPPAAAQPAIQPPDLGNGCRQPPIRSEPSRPWAQQMLTPERAWELTRGAGVTVAVIDSGVDAGTPQLAGAVLGGVDVLNQGGAANTDCVGHGTFVAGIIAARPIPGIGFAGIAPESRILPVRYTQSRTGGTATALATAIREAVDGGAQVINVSASSPYPNDDLRGAVDYAHERDVLIVAAAANSEQQGNPTTYPASYPGVLAVGAVDVTGSRASFSQTGSFVSLVAPGVDVISIGPGGPGHWQDSGTSFAAPFVAGTAALVRAYRPDLRTDQVADRLRATATSPGATVPDPEMGWGTVNPYLAVASVLPAEGGGASQLAGRVSHADIPPDNPVPLRVTLISVVGAILLICLTAIAAALGPRGWRRRWRRHRVVHVVDDPAPADLSR
ncbi:type VII secretion-associated serine protease mycosin [Saccharopolyspora sp. K220]|uniref:type VII secretion-associated serine protease mycosin n=1 Tax=Saccharopolyspora soli TaxID=2926618 RepID=UPI001F55BC97|nr:type VII secretion-associated serine protease mycosin [Saccharopolyspora soli]MCI2417482.1 type VII secretion-associated serine protease mycosin [Saccharopolyspora soli]